MAPPMEHLNASGVVDGTAHDTLSVPQASPCSGPWGVYHAMGQPMTYAITRWSCHGAARGQ